ncbi:MAG: hypothetical protein NTV63_01065 [Candidatus Woesearchaeota archaeon]|nr:hypothetical protein [Candidatus Woesearchaeota archaeon]
MARKTKENKGRKAAILSIVIVFLMLSSTIAYIAVDSSSNTIRHKNIKFSYDENENLWTGRFPGENVLFYTSPEEFDLLNISPEISGKILSSSMIVISFNPKEDVQMLAAIDAVSYDIYSYLLPNSIYVDRAITALNSNYTFPVADCINASQYVPILKFMKSNATDVSLSNNCIVAGAPNARELLVIRDKLVFDIFYSLKVKK